MKNARNNENQRGAALLYALMMLLALSISSAALWKHLHHNLEHMRYQEERVQCLALAEAGLEEGVAWIRHNPTAAPEALETRLATGRYTVRIEALGEQSSNAHAFRLVACGVYPPDTLMPETLSLEGELCVDKKGRILSWSWAEQKGPDATALTKERKETPGE